jgi:hypothetical protein
VSSASTSASARRFLLHRRDAPRLRETSLPAGASDLRAGGTRPARPAGTLPRALPNVGRAGSGRLRLSARRSAVSV